MKLKKILESSKPKSKLTEGNFVDDFLHNNKDNVNFYNALENLKAGQLNKKNILKLAKKYNVDAKEAIRFVKEIWVFENKLTEGDNTQYSWGQINKALMKYGMSPKHILRFLSIIKKI